jgi:hypothetical protein
MRRTGALVVCITVSACGSSTNTPEPAGGSVPVVVVTPGDAGGSVPVVPVNPGDAGNPSGSCALPAEGFAEDASKPTTVVGTGTAASCTVDALEAALGKAGVITFDCGPDPATIAVTHELRLNNKAGGNGDRLIDGGNKVTLDGGGKNRILYQNGCEEALGWLTAHCDKQDHPRLVVQNITFANAHAVATDKILGGGAIYVQSGVFKAVNARFVANSVEPLGSDIAGGAIYTVQQFAPSYVVSSTFGGADGLGNSAASGGALGSIGTSWTIANSVFSYNKTTGSGMSSGNGGNGGAIYNDGNTYTLSICGTQMTNNTAGELGGAIFYVSNDLTGAVKIDQSTIQSNAGRGNGQYKKSFYIESTDKAGTTGITVTNSTVD